MKIKTNDLNLKSTLLSGQCFRVTEEKDNSFTIVLKDRVVNLQHCGDYIEIMSNKTKNLKKVIIEYLDLLTDYKKINDELVLNNQELVEIINYCKGYKILNQDILEIIISYIISQNNTVKNISSSIELLCKEYGKKVYFNNKEYYLFPSLNVLIKLTEEKLKKCKVGFRSKYLISALSKLDKDYLNFIDTLNTEEALKELMKTKGIGIKVASCILLFGYKRFDTFPIDTWVKKYFNETNELKIKRIACEKYGMYSGLVIQYMFHYSRNKNVL